MDSTYAYHQAEWSHSSGSYIKKNDLQIYNKELGCTEYSKTDVAEKGIYSLFEKLIPILIIIDNIMMPFYKDKNMVSAFDITWQASMPSPIAHNMP